VGVLRRVKKRGKGCGFWDKIQRIAEQRDWKGRNGDRDREQSDGFASIYLVTRGQSSGKRRENGWEVYVNLQSNLRSEKEKLDKEHVGSW